MSLHKLHADFVAHAMCLKLGTGTSQAGKQGQGLSADGHHAGIFCSKKLQGGAHAFWLWLL